jgi:hypothetical protein
MTSSLRFVFYLAMLCALLATSASAQSTSIIVPGALANTDGNDGSPLFLRYQQVYSSSEFGLINNGGGDIAGFLFRLDQTFGQSFSTTLTNVQITLSTTQKAPGALSPVFAENVGADRTVVLGPATVPFSAGKTPLVSPQPFDAGFGFTHAFYYNPAAGNLLVDVQLFGGATAGYFDAQSTQGDSISSLGGSSASALSGILSTAGLVTEFAVVPVPEPSALVLVSFGLAVLVGISALRRGRPRPRGSAESLPSEENAL